MSSHKTILLVEDEEQVRKLLTGLLTAHAWIVTAASSGGEALARLAEFEFDITLCDLAGAAHVRPISRRRCNSDSDKTCCINGGILCLCQNYLFL
jgi:DNA-binding NtrC family response regulator